MKFTSVLALFASIAATNAQSSRCNADNCARAATGVRGQVGQSTRLASCSSFQSITVIPPTSTVVEMSTTTVVLTLPVGSNCAIDDEFEVNRKRKDKRILITTSAAATTTTIRPSSIPQFALAPCMGSARYASACSCAGITQTTSTASTPLTTSTSVSTSITVTCA